MEKSTVVVNVVVVIYGFYTYTLTAVQLLHLIAVNSTILTPHSTPYNVLLYYVPPTMFPINGTVLEP